MKAGSELGLQGPPPIPEVRLTTATGKAGIVVIKQGVNVGTLLNNHHDL